MTSTATPSDIIRAIKQVVGDAPRPVALHEPYFAGHERTYVDSCIDEGWVSSVGAFVDRFERELASFCGAKYAAVIVNGTCAIHVALITMGIGHGDEVLIPSLTFVATANAVVHAGAIPHFIEVEDTSLGIDPIALENYLKRIATTQNGVTVNKITGRPIRALMPVHVFGHPCQMPELARIAREWNLHLLEDATEALGSTQNGRPVGSAHTAAFSFNGNKIITTGGGGAIVTQDEDFYRRLKHRATTAKQPHPWAFMHDEVAYNYRMPNLNAALGCAQLEQMPHFLAAKRALAEQYQQAFANIPGLKILPSPANTESNFWLTTLLAEHGDEAWLNTTLQALHAEKLLCRPIWQPLHQLPMYRDCPKDDLRLTESLAMRIINLPSSVRLGLQYV
jgi:perosamine synthetase